MKYKTVKIPGHQRSGSHWINRLIDINFFNGSDYTRHYGGHPWGNEARANQYLNTKGQAVFYTHRNLEDAINSAYRIRHRLGLDEDDYEKFKTTPMKNMHNKNLKAEAIVNDAKNTRVVRTVDTLLEHRTETIGEYLSAHYNSWKVHEDKDNFMFICYDDLVNDFQGTMLKIAKFLGSNKTEFVDETKRVGWHEKEDNKWEKP